MSDHERGAYSPQTDAPLAFDARQSPGGGGGGFPTTLVVSLVILVLLIGAIVLFYRSGIRGAGQEPAAVGAAGAQPSDEATGLQIYKTETAPAAPSPPAFTAPPEQPQPRPTAAVSAKPAPAPTALAPAARSPAVPAKTAQPKDEIGALIDKNTAAASAPPPPVKRPPAAVKASAPAAAAGTGTSVQIGAYSSQDLAEKGWNALATVFPADMTGKGQHFEPVARDGKTLYRAVVTGFASKTGAQAFCAKLKAANRSCIVK
jgi:hypothetical protein